MGLRWWFVVAFAPGLFAGCGGSAGGGSSPQAEVSGMGASAGSTGSGATSGAAGGTAGTVAGGGGALGGSGGSTAGAGGAAAGNGGNTNGGSAGNGSAGTAGGGLAQLMPTINAYCQAAQSCCAKQATPAMLTDCASKFPTRNKVLASIDTGGVTVNAAALAKCLAAYQQAATLCDENPVIAACQGVFSGTKAEGEPCNNGTECNTAQGPTTCLFADNTGGPGVCKHTVHGKAGDACVSSCATTGGCSYETYGAADSLLTWCFEADGLYCDSSSKCQPLVAIGQTCGGDDACGSGNTCYLVCKKGAMLGQACETTACVHGLECSPDSGACVDPPFASDSVCSGYGLGPY